MYIVHSPYPGALPEMLAVRMTLSGVLDLKFNTEELASRFVESFLIRFHFL